MKKDGRAGTTQRYRCQACHRTFIARTGTPFAGHSWPQEVIVTAVRRSLRSRLSAADVRDLLVERGVAVSARTVLYWVQKFAPLLARAGRRAAARPGVRWWCDETSVRVGGTWAYLSRAGLLRPRGLSAASHADRGNHRQAPGLCPGDPRRGPWGDAHAERAASEARADTKAIERSHIPTKDRLRPMRGLQSVRTGQRAIEGVELAWAVQRGHLTAPDAVFGDGAGLHAQARAAATTCLWLADGLRVAA